MEKYCFIGKDNSRHCHCFKNNIYVGFETNGRIDKNYSYMVDKWVKNKRTEEELKNFLNKAGFKLI